MSLQDKQFEKLEKLSRREMLAAAPIMALAATEKQLPCGLKELPNPRNLPVAKFDKYGRLVNMDEINQWEFVRRGGAYEHGRALIWSDILCRTQTGEFYSGELALSWNTVIRYDGTKTYYSFETGSVSRSRQCLVARLKIDGGFGRYEIRNICCPPPEEKPEKPELEECEEDETAYLLHPCDKGGYNEENFYENELEIALKNNLIVPFPNVWETIDYTLAKGMTIEKYEERLKALQKVEKSKKKSTKANYRSKYLKR